MLYHETLVDINNRSQNNLVAFGGGNKIILMYQRIKRIYLCSYHEKRLGYFFYCLF